MADAPSSEAEKPKEPWCGAAAWTYVRNGFKGPSRADVQTARLEKHRQIQARQPIVDKIDAAGFSKEDVLATFTPEYFHGAYLEYVNRAGKTPAQLMQVKGDPLGSPLVRQRIDPASLPYTDSLMATLGKLSAGAVQHAAETVDLLREHAGDAFFVSLNESLANPDWLPERLTAPISWLAAHRAGTFQPTELLHRAANQYGVFYKLQAAMGTVALSTVMDQLPEPVFRKAFSEMLNPDGKLPSAAAALFHQAKLPVPADTADLVATLAVLARREVKSYALGVTHRPIPQAAALFKHLGEGNAAPLMEDQFARALAQYVGLKHVAQQQQIYGTCPIRNAKGSAGTAA